MQRRFRLTRSAVGKGWRERPLHSQVAGLQYIHQHQAGGVQGSKHKRKNRSPDPGRTGVGVPCVTQQCFRAGNRASGLDFGRILFGKNIKIGLRAGRRANFEVFPIRLRPLSGPGARFPARKRSASPHLQAISVVARWPASVPPNVSRGGPF